jgi:hypothetical protein
MTGTVNLAGFRGRVGMHLEKPQTTNQARAKLVDVAGHIAEASHQGTGFTEGCHVAKCRTLRELLVPKVCDISASSQVNGLRRFRN